MKKFLPVIIIAVLVIGGGAAYMLTKKDDSKKSATTSDESNKTKTDNNNTSSASFKPIKACDVLTLEDAKEILGDAATPGDSAADNVTETSELILTHCTFITSDGAIPPKTSAVSLQARSAKTQIGATSNSSVFNPAVKPAGAEDVNGLGDAAFWNPAFGQLSILKNNNYYIIQAGPSKVSDRRLDDAKKLADQIIDKL